MKKRRPGSRDDRGERPRRSRARRRRDEDFDDYDDEHDDDDDDDWDDEDDDEERRPAKRRAASGRRSSRQRGESRERPGRGASRHGKVDFGVLNVDDDERDEPPRRRGRSRRQERSRRPRREERSRRKRSRRRGIADACTPVFGYTAMLPREDGGPQPDYMTFRQGVIAAMQRMQRQAEEARVERQDIDEVSYALAAFIDEQVFSSEWNGRDQWAQEPLNIVMSQDPEAGVNFWERVQDLRDDQQDVKRVYLYCMALGFKGKYGMEDPRVQVQKIGAEKKRLLEEIQTYAMDDEEYLFPEAYEPSEPLDQEVPALPRWWKWASAGTVVGVVIIWFLLFLLAGEAPSGATQAVRDVVEGGM